MSAPLAAGVACVRPGCGHGEDLHDGICFGTACECVRFVGVGALPVPVLPEPQALSLPWAHVMPDDDLSGFLNDLVSAALNRWRTDPEGPVPDRVTLADIERVCREWRTPGEGYRRDPEPDAEVFVPQTERSRWVAIAEALNAAHSAGMPVGIDLDGTLTDRNAWSVVWDRAAEQWVVAGYEDDEPVPDAVTRVFSSVASLREPEGEFHAYLHHENRVPHDLPETGGAS